MLQHSRNMLVSLIFTVVYASSVTAFKSSRTTLLNLRLSQQQLSNSALSTSASLSTAVFPSNNVLLQQLMAASMKKKLIFLAHPIALIVLLLLMKQMFVLLPTILTNVTLFLLSLKTAFGKKSRNEERRIGVDRNGNRFYGIAQPITQESSNRSARTGTVKKRVTVATLRTNSTSSLEVARARVVNILASLEEESNKAVAKVDEVVIQSRQMGSWTSKMMRRDVEKEGKDAYIAKIKRMEKERTEKFIKLKEAEATLKHQQQQEQQQQQQREETERKQREAAATAATATAATAIKTETTAVINTQSSIIVEKTTNINSLNWTPHMMILKR